MKLKFQNFQVLSFNSPSFLSLLKFHPSTAIKEKILQCWHKELNGLDKGWLRRLQVSIPHFPIQSTCLDSPSELQKFLQPLWGINPGSAARFHTKHLLITTLQLCIASVANVFPCFFKAFLENKKNVAHNYLKPLTPSPGFSYKWPKTWNKLVPRQSRNWQTYITNWLKKEKKGSHTKTLQ